MKLEYSQDKGFYVDIHQVISIDGKLDYPEVYMPEDVNEEIQKLQEEINKLRMSHARILRAIKNFLGLSHWPSFKGNFVDGVVAMLGKEPY
jgi:hypothetical protein